MLARMTAHHPLSQHDPLGCADCPVRDSAVCAGLGDAERLALARLGRRRTLARGETLFGADDDTACATLLTGAVKLSRHDAAGTERMLALVHPAGFLARLFAGGDGVEATALTDCTLCVFARRDVEREMRAHPGFMERVLRATLAELDQSRRLVELIGRRDVRARVAGLILSVAEGGCDGPAADGATIELPLTRGEMAALLGTTIESVSRQLTAMEADGVIARDGPRGLRVRSMAALRETAGQPED